MTGPALMRTLLPSRLLRSSQPTSSVINAARVAATARSSPSTCLGKCRCFTYVQDLDRLESATWFKSSAPTCLPDLGGKSEQKPPDERALQLGKTVRILHERLPTLLQSPLPSEILSTNISLHLFPSTHPHLPTVSGRLAYIAALWTAPVAWGRVPLVGNVKLKIMSERMVRNGGSAVPLASRDEKLIVKWRTCGKTTHRDGTGGVYRGMGIKTPDPVEKIRSFIAGTKSDHVYEAEPEEFCGIFIFEFDEEGRIKKHVIEHTEQGGQWDRMTRVVSVTDWLLGTIHGRRKDEVPGLAWCKERPSGSRIRIVDRSRRLL